ncbi:MAG: tetratricopeptide repeat protein, partial [Ignavibacteriaceae bacterium]
MQENIIAGATDVPDFDKLWDYSNPAETEKKFKEILPGVKASQNKSAYLQLLTQIARTLGLQMKFEDSHKLLDEVESQLTDDLILPQIRCNLERGRAYNSSKQKDRGKESFLNAYEFALKNKEDAYAVDAAHMLGIIEPPDKSLKWNEQAMKIAENSDIEKANNWLGSLYNNTGWTYHDMGDYNKALSLFKKNIEWHTKKKSVEQLLIAKWCVARTMRSLNQIDEALKKSLSIKAGAQIPNEYILYLDMFIYNPKNLVISGTPETLDVSKEASLVAYVIKREDIEKLIKSKLSVEPPINPQY